MLCEPGPIQDVFSLSVAYVRGQWDLLAAPAARLRVEKRILPGLYADALDWCGRNTEGESETRAA
jgi:hypothetical protein